MKLFQSKFTWVTISLVLFIGYWSSCTKDDLVEFPMVVNSSTDLVSVKVTTPPSIDGSIDGLWSNATKLAFTCEVPDPGGDVFRGMVGNVYTGTIRSVYDNSNIYFLIEWNDPSKSMLREPWYFDPVTKLWAQESGSPTFSETGSITRPAFYEDKLAMLWNINESVFGWTSGTCYKSCHTNLPESDGFARHRTNSVSEKIDMWHWKGVRLNVVGQLDDQYQDNTYPNGRKSDASESGGYKDNVQTLNQPGIGDVDVPKYMIPGQTDYYYILQSEIDNGTAKLVTAISADGVLTLEGGTTIDPNTDVAYQRDGATVGNKVIPGITTSAYVGSRGDILGTGVYNGSGWVLEIKRALQTDDDVYDIDFSSLDDQYFGISIFENAQIAHGIKTNLVLKFEK